MSDEIFDLLASGLSPEDRPDAAGAQGAPLSKGPGCLTEWDLMMVASGAPPQAGESSAHLETCERCKARLQLYRQAVGVDPVAAADAPTEALQEADRALRNKPVVQGKKAVKQPEPGKKPPGPVIRPEEPHPIGGGGHPLRRRPTVWELAMAAVILVAVGLSVGFFIWGQSAPPGPSHRPGFVSGDPVFVVVSPDQIGLKARFDPELYALRVRYGDNPFVPIEPGGPVGEDRLVALDHKSPPLKRPQRGFSTVNATLEMVPRPGKDVPPQRFTRQFFLTPEGIEESIDKVVDLINKLQLNNLVELRDPQAFRIETGDKLAVEFTFNPAFVKEVRVRWGTEAEGTFETLYQGDRPFEANGLKNLSRTSPRLKADGSRNITAVLEFVPYDEARKRLPEFFFSPERTVFRRELQLTRFGIIPGRATVPALESLVSAKHKELENLYYLSGKASPRPNARPTAYLIIDPILGDQSFVGATIGLSADGTFVCKCYLGPAQLDRERYRLYVVVADRMTAPEFRDGERLAKDYDWAAKGFVVSAVRQKMNDGTDGFTTMP
jgi:hypothetical protein